MWITNTAGKKDAMLTFAVVSFAVVTLNMLLSSLDTINIGSTTIVFKSLDSSMVALYLGSTFTAYVSRRWTDKKYSKETGNPLFDVASAIIGSTPEQNEVALSQIEMESSPEMQMVPPNDEITQPIKKRKPKLTQE